MSQPSDLANAVQTLANTLLQAITDPADAIRIFTQLNAFVTTAVTSSSAIGLAQTNVQNGVADLCRRTAAVALAQASANYQPSSQNDAETIQTAVCDILDAEILIAGNQGQDETYLAFKNLRTAVSQDLTARGSALPPLKTFTNYAPVPSLVLAYRYYQDITRTDQLVGFANPVHPAFMPLSFQAVSY
jgi:prophage DNA circulation protein